MTTYASEGGRKFTSGRGFKAIATDDAGWGASNGSNGDSGWGDTPTDSFNNNRGGRGGYGGGRGGRGGGRGGGGKNHIKC